MPSGDNYNRLAPTAYATKGKLAVIAPAAGKALKFSEIAIGNSAGSTIAAAIVERLHNDAWKAGQYNTGDTSTATLDTTTPIVLSDEVYPPLEASERNGDTFTLEIEAAAANDDDEVLAAFTGTQEAIVLTITPNDGTNNMTAAEATIETTTPIVLTSVAAGEARNTDTFTLQVAAAAANPTDTVLAAFTGDADDIVCTVTPNDGTNNMTAAQATIDTTAPIILTSVAAGTARNTNTFTLEVEAAAANPTDTILADFTGTADAIVCTITPNDGANNGTVPVDLTTAELVELINTGAVAGKTVTVTDASSLRNDQTATGGDATPLANAGEGDAEIATFSGGDDGEVDLTTEELVELINTGAVVGKNITLTDASSLRILQTATGGDTAPLADSGEGDGEIGTFADGDDGEVTLTTEEVVELINTGAVAGKTVIVTDASSLRELQSAAGGGSAEIVEAGEGDGEEGVFVGGANQGFVDDTEDAQDAGTGDFPLFTLLDNDGFAVQALTQFNMLVIPVSTAQAGSPTYSYQYYNGSGYTVLPVIESVSTYTIANHYVVFHAPIDWAKGGPEGEGFDEDKYHIRVRATTAPSTAPLATEIIVGRFIAFDEALEDGAILVADYQSEPLKLLGGSGLMPYFGTANAANFIEAVYREI